MQYMGSKRRIAKTLLPIITRGRTDFNWVEPFAGGMNMIDKVETSGFRVANDYNKYIIAMFNAIVNDGWVPCDEYNKEQHTLAKTLTGFPEHELGYIGICCSFGARWLGAHVKEGSTFIERKDVTKSAWSNRQVGAKNSLIKQCKKLTDVMFYSGDYRDVFIQNGDIVYCDPPYKDTAGYKVEFDHEKFWAWVREVSQYAEVYVSEYSAPKDMTTLWQHTVTTGMSKTNADTRTERLFTYL